jgi:sulfopyruvate decarboxylase TPP-binding subunit
MFFFPLLASFEMSTGQLKCRREGKPAEEKRKIIKNRAKRFEASKAAQVILIERYWRANLLR